MVKSVTADSRVLMYLFGFMGERVKRKIGHVPFLATLGVVLTTGIMSWKIASWLLGGSKQDILQATRKEGVKPSPQNEQGENVWYKNDFVLTDFDVPLASKSVLGKEQVALEAISKNLVKVRCYTGDKTAFDQTLVCLRGNIYLANNHGIPEVENMRVKLIQALVSHGVSSNLEVRLQQSQIKRYPDKDLCLIKLTNLPPKSGVLRYVSPSKLQTVGKGYLMSRTLEGMLDQIEVPCARFSHSYLPNFGKSMDVWHCVVKRPTENGDCGSPLVLVTPQRPILVGIHTLGDLGTRAISLSLDRTFLEKEMENFVTIASSAPMLDAQSVQHEVLDLHTKSVFRYLEDGSASVYGSFGGFKPSQKSRVTETFISSEVCKTLGVEVKHGAPVLKGWAPWRRAAVEMVHPVTQLDETILDECVASFTKDILTRLPQSELDLLEVYDLDTSINGAPGKIGRAHV